MILHWLAETPALLVATAVVFVPGMLGLYVIGLRGLALLAAAPIFGVAATAVLALVFGAVGVPWSPLSWTIGVLVLVGASWGAGRLLGAEPHRTKVEGPAWFLPSAIGVGILIGMSRLIAYIVDPAGISQTNDAVFHMNAVRFIVETADASSLHVSEVVGGSGFYPAAWHALVSLIVGFTGTSIPIAANMLTVVIGALIWPLGIAWLSLTITRSRAVAAYAAVLSSALQTFPLLMFQWGVLFPNALSTALVPAAVAWVILLAQWPASDRVRRFIRAALVVAVIVAALALSQPAALLVWAAICIVWATFQLLSVVPREGLARRIGLVVVLWAALGTVWFVLAKGTSGSHWPPFRGKLEAFVDVLLNGQVLIPFAWAISVLALLGVVVAVRDTSLRWLVGTWAGVSALYILVASVGHPIVRDLLLAPWYADPYRLAALAPIAVVPLAAIGADAMTRWIAGRLRPGVADARTAPLGVAATVVLMLILVLVRPVAMPAFLDGTFDRESRYVLTSDTFLDSGERELLESLPTLVEPGSRVIGNPSTGTGFGYMLSGVDVYPRTWSQPTSAAWAVLSERLRDAGDDTEVCDALATLGDPRYVLDFGLGEDGPGRYELPGMTDFEGQDGFEPVAAEGDASLWRITACGP
ncbi:DUF6541 family protein [Microbacterium phyllosphaerae]|uniref:DUF6541 family protein n=1 Tax=Microbacterium phyllosphaerae TaxID=124798 RepID=UPI00216A6801|nr:DUF6541 family protein [Microbacterium phyllosphaerae]MCS3441763.1 hypothetical protein [Microbacterium phyllosphaerae]